MIPAAHEWTVSALIGWLRETEEDRLAELWLAADTVRRENVGDAVHLRGLVEVSNYCVRACGYCGMRAANRELDRYRLDEETILECAHAAVELGFGTVVMQGGEDPGIKAEWMAQVVRRIKSETPLAVTLSLGERREDELRQWREAGADRYLLRFETSDEELYRAIHPALPGQTLNRLDLLRLLKSIGFETGSGVMAGIPGQTYQSVANDLLLFQSLDLDMIGIGPYIPHPATPLGNGNIPRRLPEMEQVPNTVLMTLKMVALTRLLCPTSNIPATTALATLEPAHGHEWGLQRGANIIMPNVTPDLFRKMYEIYPEKAGVSARSLEHRQRLEATVTRLGRTLGRGPGGRNRDLPK